MKKLIAIIMTVALALSFAACEKKNEDAATKGVGSVDANQTAPGQDNKKDDPYVGAFYDPSGGYGPNVAYMVTKSGATEKLGGVYGYLKYTDDGKYAVWRYDTELYVKEPGKEKVTLSENVDDFTLNTKTGLLIAFCSDGIYSGKNLSDGIKKVNDMSKEVYRITTSNDGKYVAYVDEDYVLHLLNVDDFTDTVIASDINHGNELVCISENEVYYSTNEGNRYLWNGIENVITDVSYHNSVEFKQKHIAGMEKMGNTDVFSPNVKYAVVYDSNGYCRYKVTEDGFTDETFIEVDYSSPMAMDDGTVAFWDFDNTISVYSNGELTSFTGQILGGYYQNDVPYADGVLYYADGTTLKSYDVKSGEHKTVAENIFVYHVFNGYCYYLNENKEMFRVGIDEKLSDEVVYIMGTGFMY